MNVIAEHRSRHTPQEGLVDFSIDSAFVLQIAPKMKLRAMAQVARPALPNQDPAARKWSER